MDSSDSSPERLALARGLGPSVARPRPQARSPAFSAFLSWRAVPATPEEEIAHVERPAIPAAFAHGLRGSASSARLTRLHLGSLCVTARRFAAMRLRRMAFWPRFCWAPRGATQGTSLR